MLRLDGGAGALGGMGVRKASGEPETRKVSPNLIGSSNEKVTARWIR